MPARDGWVQRTAGGDVPPLFLGRARKVRAAGAGAFLRGREIRNYVPDELPRPISPAMIKALLFKGSFGHVPRALRIMMRKRGQGKNDTPANAGVSE